MNQRITSLQAVAIIVNTILPSSILFIPSYVIHISGQDGWISILLSVAAALLLAFVIGSICLQNNRTPLLDFLAGRFGKFVSTVIGLVMCGYYFITTVTVVRHFADYMSEQILMMTPLLLLVSIIVLVSVYMASQGIEVMARVHFIVFVFVLLFVGLNVLLLGGQYDFSQFLPVFDSTPIRLAVSGFMPLGWLSEIAALLLLLPYLEKASSARGIAIWGTLISGILISVITAVTIAVFGTKIIGAMSYPAFAAIGTIEIGQFVERVDVLLLSAWTASMFAKVSVSMFVFFHLVSDTFKIKAHPALYLAGGALVVAMALYSWPSSVAVVKYSYSTLTIFFLLNNYAVSLLIWCGLRLTRHKAKTGEAGV
ncbi:endospore germination permease [Paenibacillus sp. PL91]|uniref:GerAB/ArcD/ProY family transporter n=1 Tax=Paenibacillus sp. PL91 TaxID=2729538 RepID=UPI00145F9F8C|nr:endospore germination permease [Paenibacillus sp. PL91]MBC9202540.1 endospore germination permease [Paenibacillus sp. PL91]